MTSVTAAFSFRRTASSTAISSKGFMLIFTSAMSTPASSLHAWTFTLQPPRAYGHENFQPAGLSLVFVVGVRVHIGAAADKAQPSGWPGVPPQTVQTVRQGGTTMRGSFGSCGRSRCPCRGSQRPTWHSRSLRWAICSGTGRLRRHRRAAAPIPGRCDPGSTSPARHPPQPGRAGWRHQAAPRHGFVALEALLGNGLHIGQHGHALGEPTAMARSLPAWMWQCCHQVGSTSAAPCRRWCR